MFHVTLCLCLFLVISSSLATNPFERYRKSKFHPAVPYDTKITSESEQAVQHSAPLLMGPAWIHEDYEVPSNLVPPSQIAPSKKVLDWINFGKHKIISSIGEQTSYINCAERSTDIELDCKAAINLIPAGELLIDPRTEQSLGSKLNEKESLINLYLPRLPQQLAGSTGFDLSIRHPLRKVKLPAAFRAAGCVVLVKADEFPQMEKSHTATFPEKTNAAKFMYHTVWPNSRRLAELIQQKCGNIGGWTGTNSSPENDPKFGKFRYNIYVGHPDELEEQMMISKANIYEEEKKGRNENDVSYKHK
jgi:hypothetical protein